MANDVNNQQIDQGRYRGLDVDGDDEINNFDENSDSDAECQPSTPCTCSSNTQIEDLKKTIRDQTAKIEKLELELSLLNKCNDTKTMKKRKREDDIEDVINVEMIANSADKDILIKELTDENESLKKRAVGFKQCMPMEDKAVEARRSLPQPTTTMIEEIRSSINDQLGNIKEAIGSMIDEKLERKLGNRKSETYAGKAAVNGGSIQEEVSNFRDVIAAAKNEELAEDRERNFRLNNLIIHGREDVEDAEQADQDNIFFDNFVKDLCIGSVQAKSITRIGQKCDGKKRPIKVTLPSHDIKEKIMRNLKNLKNKGYTRISITDDYTVSERKIIKDFVEKAKDSNSKEPADSENIWVVRGCPKNGLFLKRLIKKNRPATM